LLLETGGLTHVASDLVVKGGTVTRIFDLLLAWLEQLLVEESENLRIWVRRVSSSSSSSPPPLFRRGLGLLLPNVRDNLEPSLDDPMVSDNLLFSISRLKEISVSSFSPE
jgi:hypothetical protein